MTFTQCSDIAFEVIREESRQPYLSKEEFPELLFECLCFDRMNSLQLAIHHEQPLVGNPPGLGGNLPGLGGNIMAQTYAASLPADDSVNDPMPPLTEAEFQEAIWQAS